MDNRYNEAGLITDANAGSANARTYTYDNNGNLMNSKVVAVPWQSQRYTYDNLNRITGAVSGTEDVQFAFDKVGNRLTRTQDGHNTSYAYLPGTNRLDWIAPAGKSTRQYRYDGHGNIIQAGNRSYIYNANNRLVRVDEDGNMVARYTYNGLGQRVSKTVGGQVTYYHYDLDGKMIAETPAGGVVAKGAEHIYRGKNLLAQVDIETGVIYRYHTNYLGAVHQLTDNNGTVVWEAVYQPYGSATVNAGSTVENNWRMPGQYYDFESGLLYNYHRYYNPAIGRYLTPDPIGLEGGINRYAYVQNNPVNSIDPFGLSECQDRYLKWIDDGAADRFDLYALQTFALALASMEYYEGGVANLTDAQMDALYIKAKEHYDAMTYGLGIATVGMRVYAGRTVRIGRWMSEAEYANLKPGARMPESRTGTTHGATDPSYYYRTAKPGSVYVEFNVPKSSVKIAPDGKVKIIGPNSLEGRNAARLGRPIPKMPRITNIRKVMKK